MVIDYSGLGAELKVDLINQSSINTVSLLSLLALRTDQYHTVNVLYSPQRTVMHLTLCCPNVCVSLCPTGSCRGGGGPPGRAS